MKSETTRIRTLASAIGILLLLLVSVMSPTHAAWVSLGGSEGSPVSVTVLESSAERIVLDYEIPGFYADRVRVDGADYYAIRLPGEGTLLENGLPELPHICRSVIISDSERMAVRILESQVEELDGYPVVPSKGSILRTVDPATVPFSFDSFYGSDDVWPKERANGSAPYILRDYRGLSVEVVPFLSHGGDGRLDAARHLVVEIQADGPDVANVIERTGPPHAVVREFAEIYRHHFLNWGFDRYTPVLERGRMLVITHDTFHDAVLPLVAWKNQMGIATTLVDISAIGNTTAAIDAYITNLFNTQGLAFVLLVGDAAQIATPHFAGGASDPSYSTILGSDNYPELFVGRFSAETVAQVETQVLRSVTYEKTPAAGADWYHKGTGVASNQGPGDDGEYDYQHVGNIRTKLLGYTYSLVDEIYDPTGTAAMVTNALNNGRSIINYCGHGSETSWGSTGFSNSHVNALQNEWMLPFIFSVACVNGQFEGITCFAEAWMRATHNGNPTGAIGTYMSSINQYWNEPMCGEDECDDLLVNDEMHTFGGLCYNGSCQMMDEYGQTGIDMFLTWHIFGDPSLVVRTATPGAMQAQHDGTMFPGQADYAVSVPGVAGALCGLYGNGVLYGAAYTDGGGAASIHMDTPPMEPMSLTLTVTGYNMTSVIEPVEVLPPSGPYLVFSDATVLDGAGDNDGVCDAGETNGVELLLENIGVEPATGVIATIVSGDPNIQVLIGEQPFGDLPAGAVGSCQAPYQVQVDANAPDQLVVPFSVGVTSNEGQWDCNFSLMVAAPVLSAGEVLIDDSAPDGNGDGGVDPGEILYMQLRVANTGHADARGLTATLSCLNPTVNILDGEGDCVNAPAGGVGLLSSFQVEILPSCPDPSTLTFHVELSGPGDYAASLEYNVSVGSWVDDAESDHGWTLGVLGDNATTGIWVRADPVGTLQNGQQAQPETDHTPDPGSLCFVTGNGTPGGAAGDSDVDGGRTTLLSPVFNLGGAVSATIEYWRWYTNNLGNNPAQDWWDVDANSDGTSWIHLEHTQESANSWTYRTFSLGDSIPLTSQVRIRFVAADDAPGSLVEAAVDDFMLTAVKTPVTDVAAGEIREANGFVSCGPNPLRGSGTIGYRTGKNTHVRVAVYDVAGRLVRVLVDAETAAGEHAVALDGAALPSGVYFIRLDTPEFLQVRQVTVVR